MKLLRTTVCLAALMSVGVVSSHLNADLITDPEEVGADEYDLMAHHMRLRYLADGSGVITPPAPAPTTAAPRTTAPPAPVPTTAAPRTTAPPTAPPATEAPATPAPVTKAPTTTAPTTAPPNTNAGSGSSSSAKKPTPAPATQKPSVENKDTGSSANPPSNQVQQTITDTPAPSVGADTVKVSTESKMSTGVVAGIVAGIVGGIAVIGLIIVSIIRRRRDDDDDPLSPFELSTDKSHTAPALLGSNVGGYGGSYNQKNTNTAYTNNTSQYNSNNNNAYAAGAAAAAAGGASVVATRARKNDTMSSNASSSAGRRPQAATAQPFYDSVTSPNGVNGRPQPNLYHSKLSSDSDMDVHSKDSSNLWLSAMEAQTAASTQANDVEGYPRDTEGAYNSPRNSYDDVPSYDIDIDQSSVISGGSDLDKEIPDLVESSSRGSYEL